MAAVLTREELRTCWPLPGSGRGGRTRVPLRVWQPPGAAPAGRRGAEVPAVQAVVMLSFADLSASEGTRSTLIY